MAAEDKLKNFLDTVLSPRVKKVGTKVNDLELKHEALGAEISSQRELKQFKALGKTIERANVNLQDLRFQQAVIEHKLGQEVWPEFVQRINADPAYAEFCLFLADELVCLDSKKAESLHVEFYDSEPVDEDDVFY